MKILVFSDIHNNIENVKILRTKEDNIYDLIIVAGDIGSEIMDDFLEIIESFLCPSFIVYGNWDNRCSYEITMPKNCKLINGEIEEINGFFITGFSGCPTSWGKNPIYRDLLKAEKNAKENHATILEKLSEAQIEFQKEKYLLDLDFLRELAGLELAPYSKNKHEKSITRKIDNHKKRVAEVRKPIHMIRKSVAYKCYQEDHHFSWERILRKNRENIFNKIKERKVPENKLIIVTHERLTGLSEEGLTPLLHIFGHIHEYKFTTYKGTKYLNAAALDNGSSALYGRKIIYPVGYCIVQLHEESIHVERRQLFPDEKPIDMTSHPNDLPYILSLISGN